MVADVARSERVAGFQTGCGAGDCVNPFVVDATLARRAFAPGTVAAEASPAVLAVRLGPNPARDRLTVTADGLVRVEVLDALGRVVAQSGQRDFDVSRLPAGVYAARVWSAGGVTARAFTIIR